MNVQLKSTELLDGQRGWHKTLTWQQGFYFSFSLACGAFISTGFTIGAIGAYGALLVSVIMATVGLLSNFLFAEMATMFPEKTGSLSMYAREGLRRYFIPGGVLCAYGYWLGYALSVVFSAVMVGQLIQAQWLADSTWGFEVPGGVQVNGGVVIAASIIVACWILCLLGVHVTARVTTFIGAAFMLVIVIVIFGVLVPGKANAANLTFMNPGWKGILIWCYIAGWTLFGSEIGAAFAPEYKNPQRDVPRVLLSSAIFLGAVFTLTPVAATAELGVDTIAANPLTYGPLAAAHVLGGTGGQFFTILLVAALCVVSLLFMNDASRATAGMAEAGDAVKQLGRMNRFGSPTWGTHAVAVVNIAVLLFVPSPVGIILAANLGYILAHSMANWSFVILRYSQPDATRPLRLRGPVWVPIAVFLGCFHLLILGLGIFNPGLAGYGGAKETMIGVVILLAGLLLWVIRRVFQDHEPLQLRDRSYQLGPQSPGATPAAQAAAE
jgi:amino acid transporter